MCVSVPSVSMKWMANRNRCDKILMLFRIKGGPASIHVLSYINNHSEKRAAQQKKLKAILMRRATRNESSAEK